MPYGYPTISKGPSVILSEDQRNIEFAKELYNSTLHQFNSIKNEENENKKRNKRASEISNELIAKGREQDAIDDAKFAVWKKKMDASRKVRQQNLRQEKQQREQQLSTQEQQLSTQEQQLSTQEQQLSTQEQHAGFRHKKPSVPQSKEILGKIRRVYKVAGSRKEHIKYKGELISVSDYKMLVSQAKALKSQNKPVAKPATKPATKPKAKSATKAKSTTKSAPKPKAKSAPKPKAK